MVTVVTWECGGSGLKVIKLSSMIYILVIQNYPIRKLDKLYTMLWLAGFFFMYQYKIALKSWMTAREGIQIHAWFNLKYWYLWHIELISHNNVSWLDDKPIAGCDLSDVSVQLSSWVPATYLYSKIRTLYNLNSFLINCYSSMNTKGVLKIFMTIRPSKVQVEIIIFVLVWFL